VVPVDVKWNTRLRANLKLWPGCTPNIRGLIGCIGEVWDEESLAIRVQAAGGGGDRAVRQTFEGMGYLGLMYRTPLDDRLACTDLGALVFTFLGEIGPRRFANNANIMVIGRYTAAALSTVIEMRVIWTLMRLCENRITKEELNRAMRRIATTDEVPAAAAAIRDARKDGDVTQIGPRIYNDSEYAVDPSAQRKAMNPLLLLAGGGGMLIDGDGEERQLRADAVDVIDGCLLSDAPTSHASTDRSRVLRMSHEAAPPRPVGGWSFV
jgi:hypothetical protein